MLNKTTQDALDHLTTWYFTSQWQKHWEEHFRATIQELSDTFNLDKASLMDKSERDGWHVILSQAVVEHFAELEFETEPLNATDDYLKRRGWKESREGRDYLTAIKNEPFSIYEVMEVKVGEGMVVKDMLRPCAPFYVHEVTGSRITGQMEHVFAKAVPVSGQYHFTGCAFRMRLSSVLERTEEIQQAILDQGLSMEVANLPQINAVVRSFWGTLLTDCVGYLLYPHPVLRNIEGHRALIADIRFPVKDRQALVLALDEASDFHRKGSEDRPGWNWITPPEAKKSLSTATQDMISIRAGLTLTEQGLKCFADSKERAEVLVSLLQAILPPETLGRPIIAYQSPVSEASQPSPVKAAEGFLPIEIQRDLVHSHLDKHYKGLLDSRIPMLKHQSPREAAQSPEGQKLVKKWLLYLESFNARAGGSMESYDFAWLWKELDVCK